MRRSVLLSLFLLSTALFASDRIPQILKQTPPIYPPWLQGPVLGQGEIMVDFIVTQDGKTTEVKAVSTVNPLLEKAAVAAVKQWLFRPAMHDGHAVACRMRVPIIFAMNGFLGAEYLDGNFTCLNAKDAGEVPTLISAAEPEFPGKYWRHGIGGVVVADFTIQRNGSTSDVAIVSASEPEFGKSVLAAIARFQFAMDPSYVGTPRVRLEIEFLSTEEQALRKQSAEKKRSS